MELIVTTGDTTDEQVDVLISTANPYLNMSGEVNGRILQLGGKEVQHELHQHLVRSGRRFVDQGTVVVTGPGPLAVRHILHAVAVDAFYHATVDSVSTLIRASLARAAELGAATVALPALACGYGPLKIDQFAEALVQALRGASLPLRQLRLVLLKPWQAEEVRQVLRGRGVAFRDQDS